MERLLEKTKKIALIFDRKINAIINKKTKVNFLVCGTQKGGTTALNKYLNKHPQICLSKQKEVHFFDNDEIFKNNKKINYNKYHSYFKPNMKTIATGECTPIYMYWKESPKRISEYNKNMKIILVLRNPIERAYSHWNMEIAKKRDNREFKIAISQELSEQKNNQSRYHSYLDRGNYIEQIKRIWEYFPKNNVLILKSEDLKKNPSETLNEITNFLKIDKINVIDIKNVHARKYKEKLNMEDREFLEKHFKKQILELQDTLGWDCEEWFKTIKLN